MSLTVQLAQFEGPLALLIYLIRKEEMDIMDIKVHEITKQYLEYIKLMKELDLELAGEFVAMAATLIQIKSKMLLPQYDENGEIVENEDPRKELVQRLLEYQKYQEASKLLYERPLLGRDIWARGVREKLEVKEDEIILEENALFSLISAYRRAVKTAKKKIHSVAAKLQSIASRIAEIKDRLIVGQRVALSDLVNEVENKRKQVLITFLSALELGKMGFVRLFQSDTYQEIYIEATKTIESDVLSSVEEYESVHAEDAAHSIIGDSQAVMAVNPDDYQDVEVLTENSEVSSEVEAQNQALANIDFALNDETVNFIEAVTTEKLTDEMASDEEIAQAERELNLMQGEV